MPIAQTAVGEAAGMPASQSSLAGFMLTDRRPGAVAEMLDQGLALQRMFVFVVADRWLWDKLSSFL